jgi:hypothetical protein
MQVIAGSEWANPYRWTDYGAQSLSLYRSYLEHRLREPACRARFLALAGKRLGCWCAPAPCHADILADTLITEQLKSPLTD